jgi:hypothetical protein|nr:MAG TPA: hypothetical protein [Caudoviricetes sp.]
MTTWLHEQALLVRSALLAGNLEEARNVFRYIFEDADSPDGIRPDLIARLAVSQMRRRGLKVARDTFTRRAESVFTANDSLDWEIWAALHAALFQDRR